MTRHKHGEWAPMMLAQSEIFPHYFQRTTQQPCYNSYDSLEDCD